MVNEQPTGKISSNQRDGRYSFIEFSIDVAFETGAAGCFEQSARAFKSFSGRNQKNSSL